MQEIDLTKAIFGLVGGLGLFIFGMKLMSEGLQKTAGSSMRKIIGKLTANRFMGTIVGIVVTAIIQSSSATTVMVVGFVNAGIMNLAQSLAVILGANIGTTITAQLIAFKIKTLALPAIGLGVGFRMFTTNKKTQYYGEVLIGFGLLFLGLTTMEGAFYPLRGSETFHNMFVIFSQNPILAVATGALLTVVVQSSSATIGITIALATTGLITFPAAAALVLGENIGTTITANLAALGANRTAKQAAFGHFLFNVLGVTYMLIFLTPFINLIEHLTPGVADFVAADGTKPYLARHIANLHSMFNVINTIVFLPLLPLLARISRKVIKSGEDDTFALHYIDDRFINTPSVAVTQAKKEVARMSEVALSMQRLAKEAFFSRDMKTINEVYRLEDTVDLMEKEIGQFLVQVYQKPLEEQDSASVSNMLSVLHELEKIADHAENIARFTERAREKKIDFSEPAMDEIRELFDTAIRFCENVITTYNTTDGHTDVDTADEDTIDNMRRTLKNNHMRRLNEGKCNVDAGILYVDILNNLEKTGDHAFNIAQLVIGEAS